MHTKNRVVNSSSEWQTIENLVYSFPQPCSSNFAKSDLTLMQEASFSVPVNPAIYAASLMITTE